MLELDWPYKRHSGVFAGTQRDVGFGESMRMYEVFRRELGTTPSEYRKRRSRGGLAKY